ncbi:Alpha/Beta hydrolase protein [Hyaloraphidium curvatum]|nr:Alpha/Beta hydrolase protein [Hyaloraphidium curvatum]
MRTVSFTVSVPPPSHPDSLVWGDDPARDPIDLACRLDRRGGPRQGIVVLCHGLLDNKEKPLVSALRERLPCDVVSFDFRGMGGSGGSTSFANHGLDADDIHHVISHVEDHFGPVLCVVAHSAGGAAGCIWAARYPLQSARVGRLVTVSALYFNGVPPPDGHRNPDPLKLAKGSRPEPPYLFATYRRGPPGARNETVDVFVTERALQLRNEVLPMSRHVPRFPHSLSMLALIGGADRLIVAERDVPLWKASFPGADITVKVLDGCEHNFRETREQDVAVAEVSSWLEARWPAELETVGASAEAKL